MQLAVWLIFFVVYGFIVAKVMCWLSARRIRYPSDTSKPRTWFFAFGGMIGLAVTPPLTELLVRIYVEDAVTKSDLGFAAFSLLRIAAFIPGAIKSRRMLQAAGIDPDANA